MKMWRDLFMFDQYFEKFDLAPEVTAALKKCKCIAYAETKEELEEMARPRACATLMTRRPITF